MDSTSTNDTKLTLPRLAAMMAEKSGLKKKTCEDFLRELFSIASDELANQQQVKIKGFGNFKLLPVEARKSVNVTTGEAFEIPAHHKVVFTPAKELAALANEAFEAFEITELDDSVTPEELDKAASEEGFEEYDLEKEEDIKHAPTQAGSPMEERLARLAKISREVRKAKEAEKAKQAEAPEPEKEAAADPEPKKENQRHPDHEPQPTPEPKPEPDTTATEVAFVSGSKPEPAEETTDTNVENEIRKRHRIMTKGFIFGFVSAAILAAVATCCLYFCSNFFSVNKGEQQGAVASADTIKGTPADTAANQPAIVPAEEAAEADMIIEEATDNEIAQTAPTQASDSKVVYDTVTETHFLTKIAKKHYGNYNLWPYIYEENKAILGHPDRIKPGTRVVVPDLAKYGVNPKNKADIEKAKKKAFEIYAKYK